MSSSDPQTSEMNPYAPPRSEVVPPSVEVALAKPASTKWLLFILWGFGAFVVTEVLREGWHAAQHYFSFRGLVLWCTLGLLQFSKRSRVAYFLGALVVLGLLLMASLQSFSTIQVVVRNWAAQLDHGEASGAVIASILLPLLLAWLGYRFIFGLPSRRYYRISHASDPADQ